jgi:hypothetical protein
MMQAEKFQQMATMITRQLATYMVCAWLMAGNVSAN